MKRSLIVLIALSLALASACSTPSSTPSVRGVITQMDRNVLTVTPAEGGQPVTVNVLYGTRVVWQNGLSAQRSALTTGQPVHVWLNTGTQDAARIVIAQ
jgi:hypothetical protein